MSELNIYFSGLIALVPSKSGNEMKVVLMEHARHEARVLYDCEDINKPETCAWKALDRDLKVMELIIDSEVSFNVDPELANHVHLMKDLAGGVGKPKAGPLSYPKTDPDVLGVLTISRGKLVPDLCSCLEFDYIRGGKKYGSKMLTEVVRLELGEGATAILKVDGEPVLEDPQKSFWIVVQPDKDLWENELNGQSKIKHFDHMYKLLDRNHPIPFIPTAKCKFGVNCKYRRCKEDEKCRDDMDAVRASGPIKCPVTLFESTDF